MFYFGLFFDCLALMSATVYAATDLAILLYISIILIIFGFLFALPVIVDQKRKGE